MAPPARCYLLDTNIVLHWTRAASPVATEIERQFQLTASPFKPLICEVTLGEMLAFAKGRRWGSDRLARWADVERRLTVIPIGDRRIHETYAELHTQAKDGGLAIQHDHNDLWIAATARTAGACLLSTDSKAFLPLRATLDAVVLDAQTGVALP